MGLIEDLNENQRLAAIAGDGPTLIVAGPGTGKTKTLTARITWLLESGRAKPDEIVALTFTNKAAREMRERVDSLLGKGKKLPKITTFHALGANILKSHGSKQKLIDERQRNEIIQSLSKPRELKGVSTRELSLLISNAKASVAPFPHRRESGNKSVAVGDSSVVELLSRYEDVLAESGLHDFDDLLIKSYNLLNTGEMKLNFKYVLVDEFQDTSELQYEILKLLSEDENLFVIGDPKQSIYSFRGAGAEMFQRFRTDFPTSLEIDLTVNYRSVPAVVGLANAIYPNEPQLSSFQDQNGMVKTVETLNEYSEAAYILSEIESGIGGSDMLKAGGHTDVREPRDYAVLYRTHRAATAVQQAFEKSGIPYQIAGEGSPYEQPESGAVIAMMRSVHSPTGTNKTELVKYYKIGKANPSIFNTLLVKYKNIGNITVSDLAKNIAETLGFSSTKNIEQFLGSLVQFGTCGRGLAACLQHIDQISETEFYDPTVNAVTLLTIHAAKGLEFNHVFLIATEEGILPKITKTSEPNFEEERRLFYVAATRAKENLDIIHAKFRGNEASKPSRFISEIPAPILPRTADPDMRLLERRALKLLQKRAQSTLF